MRLRKYQDFNKSSALSNDHFNGAIGFGAPVSALRVHRLPGAEFPSLLGVSYDGLGRMVGEMQLFAVREGIDGGKATLSLASPCPQQIRYRCYSRVYDGRICCRWLGWYGWWGKIVHFRHLRNIASNQVRSSQQALGASLFRLCYSFSRVCYQSSQDRRLGLTSTPWLSISPLFFPSFPHCGLNLVKHCAVRGEQRTRQKPNLILTSGLLISR